MGITGLIPFLEKSSKRGNISQFSGCTVAIDSYCWLHKGAFSCADKLAMGQPTDAYVRYCIKLVDMLLANRIKPILVFDGCHLPAKADTELKRRESRETNKKRAAELIAMGQLAQGRSLLRRSIDVTHEMALELIKKCHEKNVDCIVAPYEADAQLAYLNLCGIVDVVITEDSDLTLFGCKKIFFKMDINGNGLLVEQDCFHLTMNLRRDLFDMEKFRYMCILSGCDYLPSLPGIGLQKACKFIVKNTDTDILRALGRLSSFLNMKSLVVTQEYKEAFMRALITFKHQLVFCPLQRKQVRLTPPKDDVTPEQLHHAGDVKPADLAWNLALGNYDPITMTKLHNYNPDTFQLNKKNTWHNNKVAQHISIWSKDFKIKEKIKLPVQEETTKWPETLNQVMILDTKDIKREISPLKRSYEYANDDLSKDELMRLYGSNKIRKNDDVAMKNIEAEKEHEKMEITTPPSSPVRNVNPFLKELNPIQKSPCLVTGRRRQKFRTLIAFQPTVIDKAVLVKSKFFSSSDDQAVDTHEAMIIPETLDADLPSSQGDECKENNCQSEINEKCSANNDEMLKRKDSGVDMKEDIDDVESNKGEIYNISSESLISKDAESFNDLDELINKKSDILSENMDQNEDLSDYVVNNSQVSSLKSSFFKWSNPMKQQVYSGSNKEVRTMNQKSQSLSHIRTAVRKPLKKNSSTPLGSQQKQLHMYGFQRKDNGQ